MWKKKSHLILIGGVHVQISNIFTHHKDLKVTILGFYQACIKEKYEHLRTV